MCRSRPNFAGLSATQTRIALSAAAASTPCRSLVEASAAVAPAGSAACAADDARSCTDFATAACDGTPNAVQTAAFSLGSRSCRRCFDAHQATVNRCTVRRLSAATPLGCVNSIQGQLLSRLRVEGLAAGVVVLWLLLSRSLQSANKSPAAAHARKARRTHTHTHTLSWFAQVQTCAHT